MPVTEKMLIIITVVSTFVFWLAFYIYIRILCLDSFIKELMATVYKFGCEDFEYGLPWEWRYKELDKVSYHTMLF